MTFFYIQSKLPSHVKMFITSKECHLSGTVAASFTIAGVIALGVICFGLMILMLWKWRVVRQDKRKYELFEMQQLYEIKGENPIYKPPEVTYHNPMFGKDKIA